jgi:trehalose 6-phosphate synthase
MAGTGDVVIVSNRGPVSFHRNPDGDVVARRGAGGLVSGLGPVVADTGVLWVAAAMTDTDRDVATNGVVDVEGFRIRLVSVDATTYREAYDVVCNANLWFVHHGLFDDSHHQVDDDSFARAWSSYRTFNAAMADAVAADAPRGAVVLVQDYHLTLVALYLADRRPDLRCVHFSHTPFTGPHGLRHLPDDAADEMLRGLAAHVACGFHTRRWADRFEACCADRGVRPPTTFVAPLGPDPDELRTTAHSAAVTEAARTVAAIAGDRQLIVRVDRIEPSKNIVRGFEAFDRLLGEYPQWRGQVTFAAFVYPSRETLPEYVTYRHEVEAAVAAINDRWGTDGWVPVVANLSDDYPTSVAALGAYDVLLVNPVRDGLNLVAKEGPLVNTHHGVLVLSREAGAADELGEAAIVVDPVDVAATAAALHDALVMDPHQRTERAERLRVLAGTHTPRTWFDAQLTAAEIGN